MNDLELYVKNWELIKKYCINVIKIHHNKKDFIDDVMQEAYIKLYDWVNSKNYVYQIKANEETYIFSSIIKSVIYNKFKENKKEFSLDQNWWNNASDEYSYDQGISEDLDKVLYEEAIAKMNSTDVMAFELYKAGYKDYEIRNKLDLTSDVYANVLTHRGRKKVNKLRNK